ALRGQGLTPTRRHKIQEWEERVHEGGATVDDVAELEKILKRAIIPRDIAGETIFDSGKYQQSRWKTVELICHKGHAWPKDLHFPQSREVHIYEGDVWQAIREATRGEPIAVWLLGGQLSVNQFVLQDGRTYRTQGSHERLQAICAKLGNPELTERAFGENHPASLLPDIQKACVEHGRGGLWNSMGYDTREVVSIDMKACYPASFQGKGEANPYFDRFGHATHRMIRVAINGALPKGIGTGFAEIQECEFDATCHPVIPAWKGFHRSRLGPDTASCLPHRVGPAEVSEGPGGDHLPQDPKRCLVAREQGPGLLCHRKIHPGQQGRWKKANKDADDRPGGARLPSARHPSLRHFWSERQ
ncbi:MAG: hypothetical protein AB2556_21905, partial [Candidatus Thiodiazotropha sp.]